MEGVDQSMLGVSSISVFVNGNPTRELNVQRGLRQGNPLAPFLFNIMAK